MEMSPIDDLAELLLLTEADYDEEHGITGADVDAWRAWQMGRSYHDMAIPMHEVLWHIEGILRLRLELQHCVKNGYEFGALLRQIRALQDDENEEGDDDDVA